MTTGRASAGGPGGSSSRRSFGRYAQEEEQRSSEVVHHRRMVKSTSTGNVGSTRTRMGTTTITGTVVSAHDMKKFLKDFEREAAK